VQEPEGALEQFPGQAPTAPAEPLEPAPPPDPEAPPAPETAPPLDVPPLPEPPPPEPPPPEPLPAEPALFPLPAADSLQARSRLRIAIRAVFKAWLD
jgi:hypothetical protein